MKTKSWFVFAISYLLIDYIRPQDQITFLKYLRPGLVLTVILVLFILINIMKIKNLYNNQLLLTGMFIFLLIMLVPFAKNHRYAFNTVVSMAQIIPFFMSCVICVNSVERLKKFILWIIIFMVFQAIHVISHNGTGSSGIFRDENDVSLYVNTWLPFCYVFMILEKKLIKKLLFGLFIILGIGANIASFSRGGFLGLLAMIIVICIASRKKLASLIGVGGMIVIMILFANELYWNEMRTATNTEDGTGRVRIESWKSGYAMFLDNPLGVGGNNFQVRFEEYQTQWFKRGMYGRVSHSLWFTLLPELGILGVMIYLLIIKCNTGDLIKIKGISKQLTPEKSILLRYMVTAFFASLAGFFVSATFLSVLYYSHYWYLTALIAATAKISKECLEIEKRTTNNQNVETIMPD